MKFNIEQQDEQNNQLLNKYEDHYEHTHIFSDFK